MADLTKQDFVAHLLLRGFESSLAPHYTFHIQVDTPMGIAASEYVSVRINKVLMDENRFIPDGRWEIWINDSSGKIIERDFNRALEIIDTRLRVAQTYANLKEECYATPHDEA